MTELTYAKVDGPPRDWRDLKIFDVETGEEVLNVIEVDAAEGWLISYKLDERGRFHVDPQDPERAATQRIEGRFEIRRPA